MGGRYSREWSGTEIPAHPCLATNKIFEFPWQQTKSTIKTCPGHRPQALTLIQGGEAESNLQPKDMTFSDTCRDSHSVPSFVEIKSDLPKLDLDLSVVEALIKLVFV